MKTAVSRKVQLFKDIEGKVTVSDTDKISFQSLVYLDIVKGEPTTIVCSQEEKGMQAFQTSSKRDCME